MANPTAAVVHDYKPRSHRRTYPVDVGVTLYAGALVGVKAGELINWLGTDATLVAPGILQETATGGTDAEGLAVEGKVVHGDTLRNVAVTGGAANVIGNPVFATDGNVVTGLTMTSNAAGAVGFLSAYAGAGKAEVTLYTPGEASGQ